MKKCKITGCKNYSIFQTDLFSLIFNNELCKECWEYTLYLYEWRLL